MTRTQPTRLQLTEPETQAVHSALIESLAANLLPERLSGRYVTLARACVRARGARPVALG